jgi:tRNA threonylcarbamoyladenosine biosynthesis protein TsaB
MKLLAIDTASAQCSVALRLGDELRSCSVATAREHAQLILPMIQGLLAEAAVSLQQLDGIAFGRGPGSFTGVRVATSVAQGLALGTGLPVFPVSDLRALAEQGLRCAVGSVPADSFALACMDARMGEVYWGCYRVDTGHAGEVFDEERVSSTDDLLRRLPPACHVAAGMGLAAYPAVVAALNLLPGNCFSSAEPHAADIVTLAALDLRAGGQWLDPAEAQPVYLRNQVTHAPQIAGRL